MIGKENNKKHVIESIRSGKLLKYDPYSITNTFCEFFSTVGEKYAEKFKTTTERTSYLVKQHNHGGTIQFGIRCNRSDKHA